MAGVGGWVGKRPRGSIVSVSMVSCRVGENVPK